MAHGCASERKYMLEWTQLPVESYGSRQSLSVWIVLACGTINSI